MPIFGKTFFALALVAGAVHVFRKDLIRVAGILRKPLESFVKEVAENSKAVTGAAKTASNLPEVPNTSAISTPPSAPALKQIEPLNASRGEASATDVKSSAQSQTESSSSSSQPVDKLR